MGRILAIDYGLKRVGLAVTDPMQIIATSLGTIDEPKLIDYIRSYLKQEHVEALVIGIPSRLDGSETHASQPVEKCISLLQQSFPGLTIHRIDERLTSRMAQQTLLDMGLKKKDRKIKSNVDQISAVIILQSYLEKQAFK